MLAVTGLLTAIWIVAPDTRAQANNPCESADPNQIGITTLEDQSIASAFDSGAKFFFGNADAQDFSKALGFFEQAADRDYVPARNIVGTMYLKGWASTEPDFDQARSQFELAAKSCYAPALNNLGVIYLKWLGG